MWLVLAPKPCQELCGALRAGRLAAPWRPLSSCLLHWVASPNSGFACLSGGRKARPLPGSDQFGLQDKVGSTDLPLSAGSCFGPSLSAPSLTPPDERWNCLPLAPCRAPGDTLSALTGGFHLFHFCPGLFQCPLGFWAFRVKQAAFSLPSGSAPQYSLFLC